jgi:SAM-dependent methyltransferase
MKIISQRRERARSRIMSTAKNFFGFQIKLGQGIPEMSLQEVASRLTGEGIFTGGPPELFESAGRLQLATLLYEGLSPESRVLDVGCGCLRAGYWLIRFLDPGCYSGIEPNQGMLDKGKEYLLNPDLIRAKRPRFDTNDRFDFSVFEMKFDVVLARSIWSHASKRQIETMLDGFVANSSKDAFFLGSYLPAVWLGRRAYRDYKGESWLGRSYQCGKPELIHHSRKWIESQCAKRGLHMKELDYGVFNSQHWLKISSSVRPLEDPGYRMK